jgi:hypothetical protein
MGQEVGVLTVRVPCMHISTMYTHDRMQMHTHTRTHDVARTCRTHAVFTMCTPKLSLPQMYMVEVVRMVTSGLLQTQDCRVRTVGGPSG